jgi:hypothetical protein
MDKSKILSVLLATGLTLGLTAHAAKAELGIAGFNTTCKNDLRQLKRKSGWKAFALSSIYLLGKQEWQSCGSAWDYSTKANASQVAGIECRSELKRKRAPKSARCVVKIVRK